MNIDYLPDEMNYDRSNLCWNEPATADAFNDGWRAACEAMHARAQAKAQAKPAPDLHGCPFPPVPQRVKDWLDGVPPQPAADWRAACKIQMCDDGDWDVVSPCGKFWLADGSWGVYDKYLGPGEVGSFGCEISARAALAACSTPPPDWRQP